MTSDLWEAIDELFDDNSEEATTAKSGISAKKASKNENLMYNDDEIDEDELLGLQPNDEDEFGLLTSGKKNESSQLHKNSSIQQEKTQPTFISPARALTPEQKSKLESHIEFDSSKTKSSPIPSLETTNICQKDIINPVQTQPPIQNQHQPEQHHLLSVDINDELDYDEEIHESAKGSSVLEDDDEDQEENTRNRNWSERKETTATTTVLTTTDVSTASSDVIGSKKNFKQHQLNKHQFTRRQNFIDSNCNNYKSFSSDEQFQNLKMKQQQRSSYLTPFAQHQQRPTMIHTTHMMQMNNLTPQIPPNSSNSHLSSQALLPLPQRPPGLLNYVPQPLQPQPQGHILPLSAAPSNIMMHTSRQFINSQQRIILHNNKMQPLDAVIPLTSSQHQQSMNPLQTHFAGGHQLPMMQQHPVQQSTLSQSNVILPPPPLQSAQPHLISIPPHQQQQLVQSQQPPLIPQPPAIIGSSPPTILINSNNIPFSHMLAPHGTGAPMINSNFPSGHEATQLQIMSNSMMMRHQQQTFTPQASITNSSPRKPSTMYINPLFVNRHQHPGAAVIDSQQQEQGKKQQRSRKELDMLLDKKLADLFEADSQLDSQHQQHQSTKASVKRKSGDNSIKLSASSKPSLIKSSMKSTGTSRSESAGSVNQGQPPTKKKMMPIGNEKRPQETSASPMIIVDDPEYAKKLEDQRIKREMLLKMKEEKRKQRSQQQTPETIPPSTSKKHSDNNNKSSVTSPRIPSSSRVVELSDSTTTVFTSAPKRVVTTTHSTVQLVRSVSLKQQQKCLNIKNLPLDMTEKRLLDLCNTINLKDKVTKINVNNDTRQADISFADLPSADAFFNNYNKSILDSSVIEIKFV